MRKQVFPNGDCFVLSDTAIMLVELNDPDPPEPLCYGDLVVYSICGFLLGSGFAAVIFAHLVA
ncbi:hypothetical protein HYW18_03600 [Candidatus Uhrbacteria bacterium]|nr:hypothetical protein [Candidatus Uhrbacteria bacterium]